MPFIRRRLSRLGTLREKQASLCLAQDLDMRMRNLISGSKTGKSASYDSLSRSQLKIKARSDSCIYRLQADILRNLAY